MNTIISYKNLNAFIYFQYGIDTETFLSDYADNEKVLTKAMEDIYWEFTRTEVRKGKVMFENPYPTEPKELDLGTFKKPKDITELLGHLSKTYRAKKELLIMQHGRMTEIGQQKGKNVDHKSDRINELQTIKQKEHQKTKEQEL